MSLDEFGQSGKRQTAAELNRLRLAAIEAAAVPFNADDPPPEMPTLRLLAPALVLPSAGDWTVPTGARAGVVLFIVVGAGGGGGGGAGGEDAVFSDSNSDSVTVPCGGAGGHGGGSGAIIYALVSARPGDVFEIFIGSGGSAGSAGGAGGGDGGAGTDGGLSSVWDPEGQKMIEAKGGGRGFGGNATASAFNSIPGLGGTTLISTSKRLIWAVPMDGRMGGAGSPGNILRAGHYGVSGQTRRTSQTSPNPTGNGGAGGLGGTPGAANAGAAGNAGLDGYVEVIY